MATQKRYAIDSVSDRCLALQDVELWLAGRLLLRVDATVKPGEVLTVMGPSGSGKSSLLAFIAGFLASDFKACGRVRLGGEDITGEPAELSGVGLLFQDPLLFPHLSVGGNLGFGLRTRANAAHRIEQALEDIGLPGFADHDPATLSGGQKARVSLMRLMLSSPKAVLLDEPFSKLDAPLRREMRALVFECLKREDIPAVLVTHDEADAEAAGGQVITIRGNGEGSHVEV